MEAEHAQRFFFRQEFDRVGAVLAQIRKLFPNIFSSGGKNRGGSFGFGAIEQIRSGVEDRERLKIAVMKYLPGNYNIDNLTFYDFFFYANEAIKLIPKKK